MTHIQRRVLATSCLAIGGLVAGACAPATQVRQASKDAFWVDSRTATYAPLGSGATRAVIWGDPNTGPHGAFVKFAGGAQESALHTHTYDIRIVVIDGAYIYRPENGTERRVGAGQFLFIPGGNRHFSRGDPTAGALFYSESTGRFDLNVVN